MHVSKFVFTFIFLFFPFFFFFFLINDGIETERLSGIALPIDGDEH